MWGVQQSLRTHLVMLSLLGGDHPGLWREDPAGRRTAHRLRFSVSPVRDVKGYWRAAPEFGLIIKEEVSTASKSLTGMLFNSSSIVLSHPG